MYVLSKKVHLKLLFYWHKSHNDIKMLVRNV